MEALSASPSIARRTVGAKLRHIFTPKPKVTAPVPIISFPTRLSTRRKRDHNEITRDENDATSAAGSRAHVRQRVGSAASITSIETIRPESVAPPKAPRRTASMINVKDAAAASLARVAAARAAQSSPVASDASSPGEDDTVTLAHATSHNQTAGEPSESENAPSSQLNDLAAPPRKSEADEASATQSALPGVNPLVLRKSKTLSRTKSYRNLRSHLDEDCFSSSAPVDTAPVAVVGEWEQLSELPEIPSPLSEEDEDVIRRVVASIVAGAAEDEASHIRALLDRREEPESPINNLFLDHEDEDDISGLLYSASDRARYGSVVPSYDAQLELERFNVYLKPKKRQTVLWDLGESDCYAWPGMIYITDASPRPSVRSPVQRLEIEWRTVNLDEVPGIPFDDDEPAHRPDYVTTHISQTLRRSQVASRLDPRRGICTEPKWKHVSPEEMGCGTGAVWALRFWVPVPMALFVGRESRLFRLRARIAFGGWDIPWTLAHSEVVDVSIDHLQRKRVMGSPAPCED